MSSCLPEVNRMPVAPRLLYFVGQSTSSNLNRIYIDIYEQHSAHLLELRLLVRLSHISETKLWNNFTMLLTEKYFMDGRAPINLSTTFSESATCSRDCRHHRALYCWCLFLWQIETVEFDSTKNVLDFPAVGPALCIH